MVAKQKELDGNRKNKLKELREKLGLHEFIKLLQSYSDGKGDYTKEKYESDEELTIEDFEKFLAENN